MSFFPKIRNLKYPLCKDCRFYKKDEMHPQFSKCMFFGERDLVTGDIIYEFSKLVRMDDLKCGEKGDYFEDKHEFLG
jgi:hypothetical protein